MSEFLDSKHAEKHEAAHVDLVDSHEKHEKGVIGNDHLLVNQDALASAYDAENREHSMGVWEAVKLHPMACFWAFLFCFTIVSFLAQNGQL